MKLRHQLDKFVIDWILNLFALHQLWIQIRKDLHLRVEDHLLPEGFFFCQSISNLAIDDLADWWFRKTSTILTRWLKDVELRLDSGAFGGLEFFLSLQSFQSQSFFQLPSFSFFCGTLKPELFLFGQSELSILFSFLGVLLLSLKFGFLSFKSCFLLGVQFLQSELLLLRKPGLSLRFLT